MPSIMHNWNFINRKYNTTQDCSNYEEATHYYDNSTHINHYETYDTQCVTQTNTPQAHFACAEVRDYHDPWEEYYRQLDSEANEVHNWQQTVDNGLDTNNIEPPANIENVMYLEIDKQITRNIANEINSCTIVQTQPEEHYIEAMHNSSIIEIPNIEELHVEVETERGEDEEVVQVNQVHMIHEANEHYTNQIEAHQHCPKTTNCADIIACSTRTNTTTTTPLVSALRVVEAIETNIYKDTHIVANGTAHENVEDANVGTIINVGEEEAGLAGALANLRLGEQRTPEQLAYEQLMRREAWEQGKVDYTGKDSFDNIWKRITQTLESKPTTASQDADATTTDLTTSADIEDGKIEYDPETNSKIVYKVVDGGYQVITSTTQPNGTVKTQTQTFWDPKPVSAEDLIKEQENKREVRKRFGKEIMIDDKTYMMTREIEGGYEEVYTTIGADGTKSIKVKTYYDSVPEGQGFPTANNSAAKKNVSAIDKKKKHLVSRNSSVDSTDSTESRKVVQKKNVTQSVTDGHNTQTNQYQEESSYQETRRMSQNVEIRQNSHTVRKNSVQEQNVHAITGSNVDSKDSKKKRTRSSIPPPPSDFIENDTTKVKSKRVPGGVEYTYTTQLDSGKTITTSKTIYEEEETELTEEEIRQYKKTLKDAEKHKNITTTKKLKSDSGTKKIVPSENPGDVTTVETIRITGGTEYHYTTVTSEGIVKKAVKTVYDPVPVNKYEDETEEEEIVEEYEEEIIEPGEKNIRTIESIKKLPSQFSEEVTITKEKKEKKVKRSMIMSN